MSTHINIIFTGLIALVSDDVIAPSSTTAFIVKDQKGEHAATIRFTGKVKLAPADGSPINCTSTSQDGQDGRAVINCKLADTNITFDPRINKGDLFPARPPDNSIPSAGAHRDIGWILRMSNIQNGIGRRKNDMEIDKLGGARMAFGWYLAETCELDGQEPESSGRNRPALIGFRSGGIQSVHRQAVAECIMFGARIPERVITIRLQNRAGGKERVITADCREEDCLTIDVSNQLRHPTNCNSHITEGAHYDHYYELVVSSGSRLIPFSIVRKCRNLRPQGDSLPFSLVESALRGVRPLSSDFEEVMRRELGPGRVSFQELQNVLSRILRGLRFKSLAKLEGEIVDIFESKREVMDRVICPPTVLER